MVSSSMGVVNASGAGFGTRRDEVDDQMPQLGISPVKRDRKIPSNSPKSPYLTP